MNLFSLLGGSPRGGTRISPTMLAVLGVLAYRTLKGKGRLADLLGTGPAATSVRRGNPVPMPVAVARLPPRFSCKRTGNASRSPRGTSTDKDRGSRMKGKSVTGV